MSPVQTAEERLTGGANWPDDEVIARVLAGDDALFELLIRRYNEKVYRTIRAILVEDAECEDVMQEAYISAYKNLARFEHRASFSTWLIRIAVHEALARLRSGRRFDHDYDLDKTSPDTEGLAMKVPMSPEQLTAATETRELVERAILALPQQYRVTLILRDVQEMDTAETAAALEITESAVKVRLHRARALLRRQLFRMVGATSAQAFQFPATRCDRVTQKTLAVIAQLGPQQVSRNIPVRGA